MKIFRIITFKIILMLHSLYIFHFLFICFPVLSIFFKLYFYFWYLAYFFFIQRLDNLYNIINTEWDILKDLFYLHLIVNSNVGKKNFIFEEWKKKIWIQIFRYKFGCSSIQVFWIFKYSDLIWTNTQIFEYSDSNLNY